jgi:hypothetical protein
MSWRCPAGAAEQQDGQPPSPSDQQYFTQHMAAVAAASAAAGGSNVARIVDPITGEAAATGGSCGASCRREGKGVTVVRKLGARAGERTQSGAIMQCRVLRVLGHAVTPATLCAGCNTRGASLHSHARHAKGTYMCSVMEVGLVTGWCIWSSAMLMLLLGQ